MSKKTAGKKTGTKGRGTTPANHPKPSFKSLLIQYILLTAAFYFMMKSCQKTKQAEQKLKDNTTQTDSISQNSAEQVYLVKDSTDLQKVKSEIGDFAYAFTQPKSNPVHVETADFILQLNPKGGNIDYLVLKKFKNADSSLVKIIDKNQHFNLDLHLKTGKVISTEKMWFTPVVQHTDTAEIVSMKLQAGPDKALIFRYTIPKNDYMIAFDIISQGLENLIADTKHPLHWDLKAYAHEPEPDYENKFTTVKYEHGQGKVGELSALSKEAEKEAEDVNWVDFKQYFFSSFLLTPNKTFDKAKFKQVKLYDKKTDTVHTKYFFFDTGLKSENGRLAYHLKWYHGPSDYRKLATYGYKMEEVIPLGWTIFGWINKYIFFPLFDWLKSFISNYGLIIIILTLIVRLVTSPLYYKTYISQAKNKIIKPEMDEIAKKYKDNPMKRQQKIMELQSKAGVSPFSGCLPSLLFIPIFYALFRFFPAAIDLRQKHFLWINDLSSYETFIKFKHSIPLIGNHISLFAVLAAIVMFAYMKVNQSGQQMSMPTQEGMPDMSKMMKWMLYFTPVMMLFFFNNYASGLSLYYFVSTLLSLIIVYVIKEYVIDEEKVKAQIEENKKKPKKQSKFSQKMQRLMEQAEQQRRLQEEMKRKKGKK